MEGDGRGKRQRPESAAADGTSARESEEEQVETFFALLKSIREMREQLRRVSSSADRRKRPKVEGAAWTPTFQWEDFAVASIDSPAGAPALSTEGGRRGKEKKEEQGGTLDLKLSL